MKALCTRSDRRVPMIFHGQPSSRLMYLLIGVSQVDVVAVGPIMYPQYLPSMVHV